MADYEYFDSTADAYRFASVMQRQQISNNQRKTNELLAGGGGQSGSRSKGSSSDGGCLLIIGLAIVACIGFAILSWFFENWGKIKYYVLGIIVLSISIPLIWKYWKFRQDKKKNEEAELMELEKQRQAGAEAFQQEMALKHEARMAVAYLYIHMATIDGDGITDEERQLIHKLYADRIKSLEGAPLSGPDIEKIIQDAMEFYSARGRHLLRHSISDSVSRLTSNKVSMENKLGLLDDLEAISTVDGVVTEAQFSELEFIAKKLPGKQDAGVSSKLYAITYLLTLIAYWDMDGITELELEKIYTFVHRWANGITRAEFDELMIKADISYEKDNASGDMLDIFRSIAILQNILQPNEIKTLFEQFEDLANIQGKHPEQENFITGLRQQLLPAG